MLNSIEDDVLVVKFMTMQIPLHIHENGISLFLRLYPVLEKVYAWDSILYVAYTFTFMHYLFCFKL